MTVRFLILVLLGVPLPAAGQQLGINLYGLAYHFDRDRAREAGLDNEVIAGLGLRYQIPHSERLQWVFDAGVYRDSGRNAALLAGAGALWELGAGWRLGGALAALHSDTYNRGKAFIAPLPLAAYDFGKGTVNLTYIPRASQVNDVAALAAWLTWWL